MQVAKHEYINEALPLTTIITAIAQNTQISGKVLLNLLISKKIHSVRLWITEMGVQLENILQHVKIFNIFIAILYGSVIIFTGAAAVSDPKNPNTYILLLGTSGCGKSSTINFILNKTVAAVGASHSTTSAIHEYSVQISPGEAYGNVTFIDTPGFGDTRGLESDAQFIASLTQYIETHDDLSRRVPDIVLLCNRYDDNRFNGQRSEFVKMLKAIGLISDLLFSPAAVNGQGQMNNVAILLTHSKTGEDLENRLPQYRQTLENYTQFPTSLKILLADNKPNLNLNLLVNSEKHESESESDEESVEISVLGSEQSEATLWYPENVCTWMQMVLSDRPASTAMIKKLCNLDFYAVEETMKFTLLDVGDSKTRNTLQILTKMELQVAETPVSLKLFTVFNTLTQNGVTFKQDSLSYLQKSLNLLRLINMDDMPMTNVEIVRLIRTLRHDEETLKLLKNAFNTQPSELVGLTGLNYDKLKSVLVSQSIFDLMNELETSSVGYNIPSITNCMYAATTEDNSKLRIRHKTTTSLASSLEKNVAAVVIIEFQFIHCNMKDDIQIQPNYIKSVENLGNFDQNDYNVVRWKSFLGKYGTHVVQESYLGGAIHLSNVPTSWQSMATKELLVKLQEDDGSTNLKMTLRGGNNAFYMNQPASFFNGRMYHNWLNSIQDNPVSLPNSIEIKPISDYLRLVNTELANQFTSAYNYFETNDDEVQLKSIVDMQQKCVNVTKSFDLVRAELNSQTSVSTSCTNALNTCLNDKNVTLVQNYEITNKFITSENNLLETRIKLTALEIEKTQLNSENESNKQLLTAARNENIKEQGHSRELNRLLGECNANVNTLQGTLSTCTSEKNACQVHRLNRHGGHDHRWRDRG